MIKENQDLLEKIKEARKMFLEIENPTGFEVICDAILEMCFEEIEREREKNGNV